MKLISLGAALIALSASAAVAEYTDSPPTYVDLVPISDLATAAPSSAPYQATLQIPMIDWSGDFVTAYANGGFTTDPDSIFALMGVDAKLYVENDLVKQLDAYMSGDSPFMRVTQGQAMMIAPITEANDDTKMVAFYKLSFSQGDHLVARAGLTEVSDLCDSTIAIMRYGPHTGFLGRILSDAGCDIQAMQDAGQIKWTSALSGENSPYHALISDPSVDAAFVVTPDMLALTDGGEVAGAHTLVSTASLSRVISDIYVVRKDYFLANRDQISNLTEALFIAGEELQGIMVGAGQSLDPAHPTLTGDQTNAMSLMATVFPESTKSDAIDAGFFWLDADISGYTGNVKWATETNPRGWLGLNNEVQVYLAALGLSDRVFTIGNAGWDYPSLSTNLENTSGVEQPTFDASAVAALATDLQRSDSLESGEIFSFEIFFGPDQNVFPSDQYADDFKKLTDFAQAYGGAIIIVEGHSDPLSYLQSVNPARYGKQGQPASRIALRRQVQSLRNLSASRAVAARDSLMGYATDILKINMDPSQFTIVAQGIDDPNTGWCGDLQCSPATEAEWRSNMRVVFRFIVVPAEANVFVAAQN